MLRGIGEDPDADESGARSVLFEGSGDGGMWSDSEDSVGKRIAGFGLLKVLMMTIEGS